MYARAKALFGLLAVFGCLGLSSCTGPHPKSAPVQAPLSDVPDGDYGEIDIAAQNGWTMRIRPNGWVDYFYGDGGFRFASTESPPGTIDFAAILKRVRTFTSVLPKDVPQTQPLNLPGWYSVGIERRGSSQAEVRYTSDADFVRGLFQKAIAASQPDPEITELLRTHPPVPPPTTTNPTTARNYLP